MFKVNHCTRMKFCIKDFFIFCAVNNESTRKMSEIFLKLKIKTLLLTLNYFSPFFKVFVVGFEAGYCLLGIQSNVARPTIYDYLINSLSASLTKWSNRLKQFVGKWPTKCLSMFHHFVGLALKGLTEIIAAKYHHACFLSIELNKMLCAMWYHFCN